METIAQEMYEEFIMSAACSEFYKFYGQEGEAQDLLLYYKYSEHAALYTNAAQICSDFLKTKDLSRLFFQLRVLGLEDSISYIINRLNSVSK